MNNFLFNLKENFIKFWYFSSIKYLLILISFYLLFFSYGYFFKTFFYIYLSVLNFFENMNWTFFISFITMLATVVLAICAVVALSSWKKEFLFKEKIKIIKEIKVLSLSLYNKINKSRSPAPFLTKQP